MPIVYSTTRNTDRMKMSTLEAYSAYLFTVSIRNGHTIYWDDFRSVMCCNCAYMCLCHGIVESMDCIVGTPCIFS